MKYDTIPVFDTYEQHMRIFTLTRTQMHDFQPVDSLVRKEMEMEYTHFLSHSIPCESFATAVS